MKATFEFQLPEENDEFDIYVNASDASIALSDFYNYLRSEWKYNGDAYTDEQYKTLEVIRERFHELCGDYL